MNDNFEVIYKALFRRYYPGLIFYAEQLLDDEDEAEDVVQDVFAYLWAERTHVKVGDQIQSFLYRSVYTRAMNVLKHRNVHEGFCTAMEEIERQRALYYQQESNEVIQRIEDKELHRQINEAINDLPDKCREIFRLSYLRNMRNKEIAELLGVSTRTVETHVSRALKLLRASLQHLYFLLFAILWGVK